MSRSQPLLSWAAKPWLLPSISGGLGSLGLCESEAGQPWDAPGLKVGLKWQDLGSRESSVTAALVNRPDTKSSWESYGYRPSLGKVTSPGLNFLLYLSANSQGNY